VRLDDSTLGTVDIGGLSVRRLGYGAMRVSGARNAAGVRDRAEAVKIYRRAYERGINFIDTANIYGYGESEEILAEALYPYPGDLVIGTKAGFRPGKIEPGKTSLPPLGHPGHIKEECDKSLRRLRLDHIDLYQVHVPDPGVPYEETVGAFVELQRAGKVRHIGVSNVTLEQLAVARSLCTVVSVQNAYNVGTRTSENLLAVFRQIVDQPGRDVSLIMVEHDVAAVLSLSDVVFVLDFGERIAAGNPEAIRSDPAVRAAYLGDADPEQGPPAEPAPSGGGSA